MSKHTPGPWQVHGSHIYTGDPERALLAQVINPGSKASDYPIEDNARLIAASPDLLAVVATLVMHADLNPFESIGHFVEHIAPVRAALAKAEG